MSSSYLNLCLKSNKTAKTNQNKNNLWAKVAISTIAIGSIGNEISSSWGMVVANCLGPDYDISVFSNASNKKPICLVRFFAWRGNHCCELDAPPPCLVTHPLFCIGLNQVMLTKKPGVIIRTEWWPASLLVWWMNGSRWPSVVASFGGEPAASPIAVVYHWVTTNHPKLSGSFF